jgi:hypothetical protein
MADDRYVVVRVAYDRFPSHGRSLKWIAPELDGAGLGLIEDRIHEQSPRRTWAGVVSAAAFERFESAWHLDTAAAEAVFALPTEHGQLRGREYTFDGMNWEAEGVSPIVYVTVRVARVRDGVRSAERLSRTPVHA